MTEDPRYEDRQKRRSTGCAASGVPYRPEPAPGRASGNCTTPTVVPEVVFLAPTKCAPTPEAAPTLPPPLVVISEQVVKSCGVEPNTGPLGDSVTVEVGQFSVSVYFQALAAIKQHQLNYIGTLTPVAREALMVVGVSVADVRLITLLSELQAVELIDKLAAARAQVSERANFDALSRLECVWENEEQQTHCAAGALTEAPSGYEGQVNNPSVFAAGVLTSSVSQAAANTDALNRSAQALRCLWGNVEQTATCHGDLGFAEAVPVDTEIQGEAPSLRVGSVTIPAQTIFSTVSQEDANSIARQLAIADLDCFYINGVTVLTCDRDIDLVNADVTPGDADYGNPVTIPEGLVTSLENTADANLSAIVLAQSLLVCVWGNEQQTAVCPEVVLDDDTTLAPSLRSPVMEVTVPAGEVLSTESREAANIEALTRAQLGLDCLYCNVAVPPKCIPSAYEISVIPIPVADVTSAWSLHASLGLPAETFCSNSAAEVQMLARNVGDAPIPVVSEEVDCPYGNAEIQVSCIGDTPEHVISRPSSVLVERGGPCLSGAPGSVASGYILPPEVNVTAPVKLAQFSAEQGAQLSSLSTPNPFAQDPNSRVIVIAENFLTVNETQIPANFLPGYTDRARRYATELAATLALASVDCFFANCPAVYYCHGRINANDYDPPFMGYTDSHMAIFGDGTMQEQTSEDSFVVDSGSLGSLDRPFEVHEAQFTSRVSYSEVETALNAFLLASLNCYWTNTRIIMLCGSRIANIGDNLVLYYGDGTINGDTVHPSSTGSTARPVTVPERFFFSDINLEFPQMQAFQVGVSQLDCFFRNTEQIADCRQGGGDVFSSDAIITYVVPAEEIETRGSQAEADLAAANLATSQLYCHYDSLRVYINGSGGAAGGGSGTGSPCSAGEFRTGPDSLAAGAAQSTLSTAAATTIAEALLASMQGCSESPPGGGSPGNDGAQTGCDGLCFGYFS